MRKLLAALAVVTVFLCGSAAYAQQPAPQILNPSIVQFTPSEDHATVTSYIMGYFAEGATLPTTEVDLGKPAPDATNLINAPITVKALNFGYNYTAKVRAIAGTFSSPWSLPSNVFGRVPGKPGDPTVKDK